MADGRTTGSGRFTFGHRPITLPDRVREHLGASHGAFSPDRELDGGDGSTWFALKSVGLLRLDPALTEISVVGGDPLIQAANIHGSCLVRLGGDTWLGLASDDAQTVWLTDMTGRIVRTFSNPYGPAGSPFNVCDVEMVDGRLYAANGYADNVCFSCDPFGASAADPGIGHWDGSRFGGQGTRHGRFATAHGLTRVPGTNVFTVADRENSRLESFAPPGRFVATLAVPPGALPCSVDYYDRFALVACLEGPLAGIPAPIYVFEDGNLISEINIGRDLGLAGFDHIHSAAFRVIERPDGATEFLVLASAWNPGNFAILESRSQA